jgi:hypothetical protein
VLRALLAPTPCAFLLAAALTQVRRRRRLTVHARTRWRLLVVPSSVRVAGKENAPRALPTPPLHARALTRSASTRAQQQQRGAPGGGWALAALAHELQLRAAVRERSPTAQRAPASTTLTFSSLPSR